MRVVDLTLVAAALLLLSYAVGCISTPSADDKPGVAQQKIDAVISSFNASNPSSFNTVEDMASMGPEAIPPLLKTLDRGDVHSKWAAIYALSRVGFNEDAETRAEISGRMRREFGGQNPSLRVMAAGVATIFGDKEGIPVLIGGLRDSSVLMLSEPPQLVCGYCSVVLVHYTGQDFGYECDVSGVDEEAAGKWGAWWAANADNIVWDEGVKKYRTQ